MPPMPYSERTEQLKMYGEADWVVSQSSSGVSSIGPTISYSVWRVTASAALRLPPLPIELRTLV